SERVICPCRWYAHRASTVEQQREFHTQAEILGAFGEVQILSIGLCITGISSAAGLRRIGIWRSRAWSQADHVDAVVLQHGEHIQRLPGILPPGQACRGARSLLFFQKSIVDAPEENRA